MLVILLMTGIISFGQRIITETPRNDSTPAVTKKIPFNKYDSATKAHPPRAAALRSAIIPGWGQVYNKKYWKVPIVYAALGITGVLFFWTTSKPIRNTSLPMLPASKPSSSLLTQPIILNSRTCIN